jgi:hypothetical protein
VDALAMVETIAFIREFLFCVVRCALLAKQHLWVEKAKNRSVWLWRSELLLNFHVT